MAFSIDLARQCSKKMQTHPSRSISTHTTRAGKTTTTDVDMEKMCPPSNVVDLEKNVVVDCVVFRNLGHSDLDF